MLPYLFFRGFDNVQANSEYMQNMISAARTFNKILEAGNEFLETIRDLNK